MVTSDKLNIDPNGCRGRGVVGGGQTGDVDSHPNVLEPLSTIPE